MKGRTTIIIAHRMSTIEKCDKIFVLDQGRVRESGALHELQDKKDGFFANLAKGKNNANQPDERGGINTQANHDDDDHKKVFDL
jgi:ABC-type transport system involved in cytochrome bd biosynthesis fused ATPase/permease subunit